jgi:hypothetical protein
MRCGADVALCGGGGGERLKEGIIAMTHQNENETFIVIV